MATVTVEEMTTGLVVAIRALSHGEPTFSVRKALEGRLLAARDYLLAAESQIAERDAQIAEMRTHALDSDVALDIIDDMVRRGNGAVVLCVTENGSIGLWIGDCDENTKTLGTGDTVYEAITEAAANQPVDAAELGLETNDGDK